MEITYLGNLAFRLKTKTSSVVTEPVGSVDADIVVTTDKDKKTSPATFVINGPGEYEVRGISVVGVYSGIFVIELDGLRIVHLGKLDQKLSERQMEEIGPVDVVMVGVGTGALELVRQLDPWVVIPMGYDEAKLEEFLKGMARTETTPQPKLVLSADKLPTVLSVVVLEKKS